jgi:uncharacterized DUF497 family protein
LVFKWDVPKAAANLKKHGIDFHEAATVLNDALSSTFPDREHSVLEPRFITIGISSRGRILVGVQRITNEDSMKKTNRRPANDMLPEYDFASMKGGVRGRYAAQYRAGNNLVLLDPEVAKAFPSDAAVNQALRAVLSMTKAVRLPSKALHRTRQKASRR